MTTWLAINQRGQGALSLISTPHSVHCTKHLSVVRLEPFSHATMSLLNPRRFRELVLSYRLLSWAKQRAPICLMYMTFSSLNGHVVPN